MTRYFFHLCNDQVLHDEEGIELPDLEAARDWGRREVRYQAAESIKAHSHLILSHKLVICDAGGELDTITFGDVVKVG